MNKQFSEILKYIPILNQIFEIENKVQMLNEENTIDRNIKKLQEYFSTNLQESGQDVSISYHNPLGENYAETRTDCEASIAGNNTENLIITEVIKPIIRVRQKEKSFIIQRAIVIAESKNKKG